MEQGGAFIQQGTLAISALHNKTLVHNCWPGEGGQGQSVSVSVMEARPTIASSTMVKWLGFRANMALGTIWSVLVVSNHSTGCAESETADELLDM